MQDVSISICVPAFNEEKTLAAAVEDLVDTLSVLVREIEVIIVNDGSSDSTLAIAEGLASKNPQIKVINHKNNLGVGVSFRDALAKAKYKFFTWFPGDHENSAQEFTQCLDYLSENVLVTTHHKGYDNRSFMRRFISGTYTWILNRYFNLNLKYYNGLTIFPTEVLRSFTLVSNGFFFTAESMIKTAKKGYKVIELSGPLKKRNWGKSKALTPLSIVRLSRSFISILFKEGRQLRRK